MVEIDSGCGGSSGGTCVGGADCSAGSEVEDDEAESGKLALGSKTSAASRDARSMMAAFHEEDSELEYIRGGRAVWHGASEK